MTTRIDTLTRGAGALVVAIALVGCATTQTTPAKPLAAATPSFCLTQTGSRIPAGNTDCTAVGRSYSEQEIRETGRTTAAGALEMLDPTVTIAH
jgi:hypothetical protein